MTKIIFPTTFAGRNCEEDYNRIVNAPDKTEEEKPTPNLENILKKYANGASELNLTPLEKTAVNTATQKQYDELMQVYEAGKWKWVDKELPTSFNYWKKYNKKTCVDVAMDFHRDKQGEFRYSNEKFYKSKNWNVISAEKFYEIQKVNSEILNKLNTWFEKNKPDRKSKGK